MFSDDPALSRAVFQAVSTALSLPPEEASSRIFRAYASPPPPQADRDRNLCFYHLAPDVTFPLLRETTVRTGRMDIFRFIPYQLFLVFYGADSESWALRCRENLFQDGAAHPLGILRRAGLYLIPPSAPPSVFWEESDSLYRKRADLVLNVRLLDNTDAPSSPHPSPAQETVAFPPEVVLHAEMQLT